MFEDQGAPQSIADRLISLRTGKPVPQRAGEVNPTAGMPNIYGDSRNLPAPNFGVPAPHTLGQQVAATPAAPEWWEDGYVKPTQPTSPAESGSPAVANQQGQSAPSTASAASVQEHVPFKVSGFSIYNDQFKQEDIGKVIQALANEGRINPMRGIQQADMDALLAGDMTKLPSILSAAVVAGISEAVSASTALMNSNLGTALESVLGQYSQYSEINSAVVTEDYKTPAERALAKMYKDKFVQLNPKASAKEISVAVKRAMEAVGSELVTARQPMKSTAQDTNWAIELD